MEKLKTINIKGKNYVQVNERVRAFREHFFEYSLETELLNVDSDTALMRAIIRTPEGRVVATGTAFERKDNASSLVNKTSHVENCETSAWGRALANFGIGIDESIASAQEVANAVLNKDKPVLEPVLKKAKTEDKPVPKKETLDEIGRLAKELGQEEWWMQTQAAGMLKTEAGAQTILKSLEKKLSDKLNAL